MKYNRWILLGVNMVIVIIGSIIFSANSTIVTLVNNLFFISFLYLIIWLFLLTVRGGFYDGITFSFLRFHHIMTQNRDYLEGEEEEVLPSDNTNGTLYQLVKFQASVLLFIFFTVLVLYYLI